MLARASSRRSVCQLAGLRSREIGKLLRSLCLDVVVDHQQVRVGTELRDRYEIFVRIKPQLRVHVLVIHMRSRSSEEQCVSIGFGSCSSLSCSVPGCTADVFDDDGLAPYGSELVADNSGSEISRTAGDKADEYPNRSCWITLRPRQA